ncbi:hypothetical protein [Halostella litorea]|uniref:hypothetical protein n=1 Tax=Halostella litorea TaxID=2528831 RepID=UPI0010922E8E|nr:hypothetical protein [Halostella litorea]
MVDITLFELHVDGDPQFAPSWATGDEDEPFGDDDDGTAVDVDDGSDGAGAKVLVGLVALVAMAAIARKFRGGDDGLEEEEEPEYTVEEPA